MKTAGYSFMSLRHSFISYGVLALATWFSCCIQSSHAQSVTLGFNSLPSAQGWTYTSIFPESNIFTLGNNLLAQNSFGIGSNAAIYTHPGVNISASFTLNFRGRVINEELGTQQNAYGFGVQANYDTREFSIGLGAGRVMVETGISSQFIQTVDTSIFHDYLFTGEPVNNTWQLFIDGTFVGTGTARPSSSHLTTLYLGDMTNGANAQGEWTRLEFSQVAAVPEPGTIFLTGISALGFGLYLWQRRRRQARLARE